MEGKDDTAKLYLEKALTAIEKIQSEYRRTQMLEMIEPYLSPTTVHTSPSLSMTALEGQQKNALPKDWRIDVLLSPNSYTAESVLQEVLILAQKVEDKDKRGKAMKAASLHLAQLGQQETALMVVRNIEAQNWQAAALAELTTYLLEPLKGEILQEALQLAQGIQADVRRAKALAAIIPCLVKHDRVEEAIALTRRIEYRYWQENALVGLALNLTVTDSSYLEEILTMVEKLGDADIIFARISPQFARLPATTRLRIGQKILAMASTFTLSKYLPLLFVLGGTAFVAEAFYLVARKLEQLERLPEQLERLPEEDYGDDGRPSSHGSHGSPPKEEQSDDDLFEVAQLVRYPNLDCPDRTVINQKFSLFVQLSIEPPKSGIEAVAVEDTGILKRLPEVEVVLRARSFDIEGSNTRILTVKRDDDSEERFILIPRLGGEQQVRVDFYQHGRRIGTARHNLLVVEMSVNPLLAQPKISQPDPPMSLELKTSFIPSPPDLELCIELDKHDGRTLHFTLHSPNRIIGYHHSYVGQVTLQGSPLEKMQVVYQEMSSLAAPTKSEQRSLAERRIATLGRFLWDELIPDKLKQEYWRFKSQVRTFIITSDEPWIPWEMMRPYRYDDEGERFDELFWCQQFALSRWLPGPGIADKLPLGKARSVSPYQINLSSVKEEIAFIKRLSELHPGITVLETLSNYLDVLDWLETQDFSMLHFACHGLFDATSPDNSAIRLSDSVLRPSDIRVRFGGKRLRPLIFINACHGGRSEFSFTGLGGWAERLVAQACVGAFIGAMWEVNDELALRFAQRFYTGLLKQDESIAEAFRQAREEIRLLAPYNSTWLAYALYADPEGRVEVNT